MSSWRAAGLTYINYSSIAARCLRNALKPEFKAEAMKRGESHMKVTRWEGGKPSEQLNTFGATTIETA